MNKKNFIIISKRIHNADIIFKEKFPLSRLNYILSCIDNKHNDVGDYFSAKRGFCSQ
jgi:hypothetical protein